MDDKCKMQHSRFFNGPFENDEKISRLIVFNSNKTV